MFCAPLLAIGGWVLYNVVTDNLHTIVPGQVYRSSQPSPEDLAQWKTSLGIKSVLNLRGDESEKYPLEKAACNDLGLVLIDSRSSAGRQPSTFWVKTVVDALENAPRPILIHCKVGADRTGVAAVLAGMAVGGETYDQALRHLSLLYGHVGNFEDRVEGLLMLYEEYCRANGLSTGGWTEFRRWALEDYVPQYYRVQIDCPSELTCPPGSTVNVKVTVTNRSHMTIPAGDANKRFTVSCYTEMPNKVENGQRKDLPKVDIPPGGSTTANYPVVAPSQLGTYQLHFDIVEENRTWFARQGSPPANLTLRVEK